MTKTWRWNHVHGIQFLLAVALLVSFCISSLLYLFVQLDVPAIYSLASYRPKLATLVLDRHGREIERFYTENRRIVPLGAMPPLLSQAFVAAEDARFFSHAGVDGWSIVRAMVRNLRSGARSQGGSTITQQVTRSLLLNREKSYTRKLKEAILSYRIDRLLTKEEILHIYLNQIYLGDGAYGVEAAARTYFDKSVQDLTLAEIAILAGLPQAPSRYSPVQHPTAAKARQVYVLNRMAEDGLITAVEAREAHRQSLHMVDDHRASADYGYFLQYVRNEVRKRYGVRQLNEGGLVIQTTLDQEVQAAAAVAVRHGVIRKDVGDDPPQAALVAMEVDSGRVRALVGGVDFTLSQFDRAVQARRQPGSAFKPVVYAAALEQGLSPDSVINDAPLRLSGQGGALWQPRNFDNAYLGPTTLRTGLVQSRNVVAVKLLRKIGIPVVIELANRIGIHSPLNEDLSLALGSSGVSLLELTGAYTVFANQGRYAEPLLIETIVDRDNQVIFDQQPAPQAVLARQTAKQMDEMLRQVVESGTGRKAQIVGSRIAGKTGTTDQFMDAWFIGYTPTLVAGVWLGHDQQRSLGRHGTGGHLAAPIWRDFMQRLSRAGGSGWP